VLVTLVTATTSALRTSSVTTVLMKILLSAISLSLPKAAITFSKNLFALVKIEVATNSLLCTRPVGRAAMKFLPVVRVSSIFS